MNNFGIRIRVGVRGAMRIEWQNPKISNLKSQIPAPLTPALSPCCVYTVRIVHGAREDWAASWVGLGWALRLTRDSHS
jgi:hypothetical protein